MQAGNRSKGPQALRRKVPTVDSLEVEPCIRVPSEQVFDLIDTMGLRWVIVPPEYTEEVGDEGVAEHPVGTGPFKFVEWVKGDGGLRYTRRVGTHGRWLIVDNRV